jgi:thiol-disulfide isomerase/thioredoxin
MKHGRREALILGIAGLAAASAGFLVGPTLLRQAGGGAGGTGKGSLPTARLVDLAGRTRELSEWRDRVLICNFWATWCAPCREESRYWLLHGQNTPLPGSKLWASPSIIPLKVRDFAASFNISYPILLAEADGLDLMRQLGNSAGGFPILW